MIADYRVGSLRHGAVRKHRIHVGNEKNAAATGSGQRGHEIVSDRGGYRGYVLYTGTETLKFSLCDRGHRCEASTIACARVDLHQLLQQRSRIGLAGLGRCKDPGVWRRPRRRRVHSREHGDGNEQDSSQTDPHVSPIHRRSLHDSADALMREGRVPQANPFQRHGVRAINS